MSAHIVRVLAESKDTSPRVSDANTGEPLFFWRGNSLRIELALAALGQFLLKGDVGTIHVLIKPASGTESDPSNMIAAILAADCDAGFTAADWGSGVGQLCVAEWTKEEAGVDAGDYVLIVSHTDPTGKRNTYLSTQLTVKDDQHETLDLVGPQNPPPAEYQNLAGLIFKGFWNADTNTPVLSDGTGSSTEFYIVETPGSSDLGSGSLAFAAADHVVHDGGVYVRIPHPANAAEEAAETSATAAAASAATAEAAALDAAAGGVTLSTDQTITGKKTHTDDVRIAHSPDHDDALLPRRMMDERYGLMPTRRVFAGTTITRNTGSHTAIELKGDLAIFDRGAGVGESGFEIFDGFAYAEGTGLGVKLASFNIDFYFTLLRSVAVATSRIIIRVGGYNLGAAAYAPITAAEKGVEIEFNYAGTSDARLSAADGTTLSHSADFDSTQNFLEINHYKLSARKNAVYFYGAKDGSVDWVLLGSLTGVTLSNGATAQRFVSAGIISDAGAIAWNNRMLSMSGSFWA